MGELVEFPEHSCIDAGDTAWVLLSSVLVLGMMPALAFFEMGMVRTKNTLSILCQILTGMCISFAMWYSFGFSLAFGKDHWGIIGGFEWVFFRQIEKPDLCLDYAPKVPALAYAFFQMMFSAIAPLLITGAVAERMKFKSFIVFVVLWEILVYYPIAHWVWGNDGFLKRLGTVDFAGGIVLHTSAGASSLVAAWCLGPRIGIEKEEPHPHNLPLASIGGALLWFGWYGFNAGSAYSANFLAAATVVTTTVASSICMMVWITLSAMEHGRAVDCTAILNGMLSGLAGITPASGFVRPYYGLPIGILLGFCSFFGAKLVKEKLKVDDALEVTAVHGITGVIGSLCIGLFASPEINHVEGAFSGNPMQLVYQFMGVLIATLHAGIMTYLICTFLAHLPKIRFRVREAVEEIGIDWHEHTRRAYYQLEQTLEDRIEEIEQEEVKPRGFERTVNAYKNMGLFGHRTRTNRLNSAPMYNLSSSGTSIQLPAGAGGDLTQGGVFSGFSGRETDHLLP